MYYNNQSKTLEVGTLCYVFDQTEIRRNAKAVLKASQGGNTLRIRYPQQQDQIYLTGKVDSHINLSNNDAYAFKQSFNIYPENDQAQYGQSSEQQYVSQNKGQNIFQRVQSYGALDSNDLIGKSVNNAYDLESQTDSELNNENAIQDEQNVLYQTRIDKEIEIQNQKYFEDQQKLKDQEKIDQEIEQQNEQFEQFFIKNSDIRQALLEANSIGKLQDSQQYGRIESQNSLRKNDILKTHNTFFVTQEENENAYNDKKIDQPNYKRHKVYEPLNAQAKQQNIQNMQSQTQSPGILFQDTGTLPSDIDTDSSYSLDLDAYCNLTCPPQEIYFKEQSNMSKVQKSFARKKKLSISSIQNNSPNKKSLNADSTFSTNIQNTDSTYTGSLDDKQQKIIEIRQEQTSQNQFYEQEQQPKQESRHGFYSNQSTPKIIAKASNKVTTFQSFEKVNQNRGNRNIPPQHNKGIVPVGKMGSSSETSEGLKEADKNSRNSSSSSYSFNFNQQQSQQNINGQKIKNKYQIRRSNKPQVPMNKDESQLSSARLRNINQLNFQKFKNRELSIGSDSDKQLSIKGSQPQVLGLKKLKQSQQSGDYEAVVFGNQQSSDINQIQLKQTVHKKNKFDFPTTDFQPLQQNPKQNQIYAQLQEQFKIYQQKQQEIFQQQQEQLRQYQVYLQHANSQVAENYSRNQISKETLNNFQKQVEALTGSTQLRTMNDNLKENMSLFLNKDFASLSTKVKEDLANLSQINIPLENKVQPSSSPQNLVDIAKTYPNSQQQSLPKVNSLQEILPAKQVEGSRKIYVNEAVIEPDLFSYPLQGQISNNSSSLISTNGPPTPDPSESSIKQLREIGNKQSQDDLNQLWSAFSQKMGIKDSAMDQELRSLAFENWTKQGESKQQNVQQKLVKQSKQTKDNISQPKETKAQDPVVKIIYSDDQKIDQNKPSCTVVIDREKIRPSQENISNKDSKNFGFRILEFSTKLLDKDYLQNSDKGIQQEAAKFSQGSINSLVLPKSPYESREILNSYGSSKVQSIAEKSYDKRSSKNDSYKSSEINEYSTSGHTSAHHNHSYGNNFNRSYSNSNDRENRSILQPRVPPKWSKSQADSYRSEEQKSSQHSITDKGIKNQLSLSQTGSDQICSQISSRLTQTQRQDSENTNHMKSARSSNSLNTLQALFSKETTPQIIHQESAKIAARQKQFQKLPRKSFSRGNIKGDAGASLIRSLKMQQENYEQKSNPNRVRLLRSTSNLPDAYEGGVDKPQLKSIPTELYRQTTLTNQPSQSIPSSKGSFTKVIPFKMPKSQSYQLLRDAQQLSRFSGGDGVINFAELTQSFKNTNTQVETSSYDPFKTYSTIQSTQYSSREGKEGKKTKFQIFGKKGGDILTTTDTQRWEQRDHEPFFDDQSEFIQDESGITVKVPKGLPQAKIELDQMIDQPIQPRQQILKVEAQALEMFS